MRSLAAAAAFALLPMFARAAVTVEQIEAFEDPAAASPKTHYAPIDFAGNTTVAGTGVYSGVTFHIALPANDAHSATQSSHADLVGQLAYGSGAAGNPFVTSVYSASADNWIPLVVNPQNTTSATGPIPGHFDGGAQVINNSYIDQENSSLDALRRYDFMIHRDDVAFIAAAARDPSNAGQVGAFLDWSAYNSLAVVGTNDVFSPTGSPGKAHADVYLGGHASFATAIVSGYAAGLYGNAQAHSQVDAQHDVVLRSLLMTGADKINYSRDTANNLSLVWGAGQADYANSLAILNAGEQPLKTVTAGNIAGPITSNLKGWTLGTSIAGGNAAVVFHSDTAISQILATLNWDVDSNHTATTIDTTSSIFPDLGLELRPITFAGGSYTLGSSFSDVTLHSDATNDNVEHLYFTGTLPAGDYAFLIRGDTGSVSPTIGFSYNVTAVPEPRVLGILLLASPLLLLRRRERRAVPIRVRATTNSMRKS